MSAHQIDRNGLLRSWKAINARVKKKQAGCADALCRLQYNRLTNGFRDIGDLVFVGTLAFGFDEEHATS